MLHIGQRMNCAVLESDGSQFVPTGKTLPVEVRQVKGNSVRIKVLSPRKYQYLWVQKGMLTDA